MGLSTFFLVATAAVAVASSAEKKRVVDVPARLPPVAGGAKISARTLRKYQSHSSDRDESETVMVGEQDPGRPRRNGGGGFSIFSDNTPAPVAADPPASFIFLDKYPSCFFRDEAGQGSCNSCWAFSVQKMLQARLCAAKLNARPGSIPTELSPLAMLCALRLDGGICAARDMGSALDYIKGKGLTGRPRMAMMGIIHGDYNNDNGGADGGDDASLPVSGADKLRVADPSNPSEENCRAAASGIEASRRYLALPRASSPPYTANNVKRYLSRSGPVIAMIRLAWEFLIFTGSLFNPAGKLTFCRWAEAGDAEDYCSPAREASWDAAQRQQQLGRPSDMDRDEWEMTWYNHFVVLHGYGTAADGTAYWVVENSWGDIYTSDPALGNYGAGPLDPSEKSHFVLVANRVAGAGGLEMLSRAVFWGVPETQA